MSPCDFDIITQSSKKSKWENIQSIPRK
jgi:hypothetical protein